MTIKNRVSGKIYHYPAIAISMTDQDIIDRITKQFGNKVFYNTNPDSRRKCLPQWRAGISGKGAVGWMRKLYPFMGQRRQTQIDATISKWENRTSNSESRVRLMKEVAKTRRRERNGKFVDAL